MSKLFNTIFPSMLAGGLLFGSAFVRADDGRTFVGFWPAAADVGGVGTAKKAGSATAPTPPTPPTPPSPRSPNVVPPAPPHAPAAGTPVPPVPPVPGIPPGINVSIHDGKVTIDGIDKLVDEQISNALKSVQGSNVPPEIRKKVEERLAKVREKVKKRLAKIDANNLDDLGEQLGDLGDEIGEEMDQFGEDMDAWGDKVGKDMQKEMEKKFAAKGMHFSNDDDDNDIPSPPDVDDDDDLDDAVRDLGDLHLSVDERAKISQVRADTDKQVAVAKHSLDAASDKLKKLLENPKSTEAEVASAIDLVSQQEAAIRKARITAWVRARNILSDDQRKKVEDAAKKHK